MAFLTLEWSRWGGEQCPLWTGKGTISVEVHTPCSTAQLSPKSCVSSPSWAHPCHLEKGHQGQGTPGARQLCSKNKTMPLEWVEEAWAPSEGKLILLSKPCLCMRASQTSPDLKHGNENVYAPIPSHWGNSTEEGAGARGNGHGDCGCFRVSPKQPQSWRDQFGSLLCVS